MTKKINYRYGGGTGEIFLSLKWQKFFSVSREEDREELHRLYGGKQYYWSRSGRSGAGFLLPGEDDLVVLPTYRTDTVRLDHGGPGQVLGVEMAVPMAAKEFDPTGKVVVVLPPKGDDFNDDKPKRLVFLPARADVILRLLTEGTEALEDGGWKSFVSCYRHDRRADQYGWSTYRLRYQEPVKGIGTFEERELLVEYAGEAPESEVLHEYLTLFAGVVMKWEEGAPKASSSQIDRVMGLEEFHGKWVRRGRFGLIREVWGENPRLTGSLVTHQTGWTTVGSDFAYRRTWDDKMFCIFERSLPDGGFVFVEEEVNLARFYLLGLGTIKDDFETKVEKSKTRGAVHCVRTVNSTPTNLDSIDSVNSFDSIDEFVEAGEE